MNNSFKILKNYSNIQDYYKCAEKEIKDAIKEIKNLKTQILNDLNYFDYDKLKVYENFENKMQKILYNIKKTIEDGKLSFLICEIKETKLNKESYFERIEDNYQDLLQVYRIAINNVRKKYEKCKHDYLISNKNDIKNNDRKKDNYLKQDVLEKMKKTNNDLQNIFSSMKEQVYISNEHIQSLNESSKQIKVLKDEFTQFTSLIGSGYNIVRDMKLKKTLLQILYYFCFVCYFWIVLYIINARF